MPWKCKKDKVYMRQNEMIHCFKNVQEFKVRLNQIWRERWPQEYDLTVHAILTLPYFRCFQVFVCKITPAENCIQMPRQWDRPGITWPISLPGPLPEQLPDPLSDPTPGKLFGPLPGPLPGPTTSPTSCLSINLCWYICLSTI